MRPSLTPFIAVILSVVSSPGGTAAAATGEDPKGEVVGEVSIRGVLPLSSSQREALAGLVRSDPEAAALHEHRIAEARSLVDAEPRPTAVIHYEGLVNTDPRRIETVEHLKDMDHAAALLEAWQATGQDDFARACRSFVVAWADTYGPTGNDVNENKLMPLLVIYEAMRPDFDPEERERVDAWLMEIARLQSLAGEAPAARRTNRHTKRLRIIATIGLAVDRREWLDQTWADFEEFVEHQLYPDGESYDLHNRDTLTYHCSALRPLVDLAVLAARDGRDLYSWASPTRSSLKESVDFVVPFASGEKQRREWENTRAGIDRRRAEAGLDKYQPGRLFEPKSALSLLEDASFFDPSLVTLVARLAGKDAERFPTWRTVLNAACH